MSKTTQDIITEYINSSNSKKSTLAGSMLDQYKNIQDNTLNAKNEAYQAQLNAMKYSDNVLKQQGLANTGKVQSNSQNISNNYMNTITGINANKLQAEKDLVSDYRKELDYINQSADANAKAEAESLLPYYMEDEARLNEYMSQIENNPDISQETKDYLNRYVNAMNIQKDALTDAEAWKNDRDTMLTDVEDYISKGKIEDNKLNTEQIETLTEMYQDLLNSKTNEEAEKAQEEIDAFIEKLNYDNDHPVIKTSKEIKDSVMKSEGDGTMVNPYIVKDVTYEELEKMVQGGNMPVGTYISIKVGNGIQTFIVSQKSSGKWKLKQAGNTNAMYNYN